MNPESVAEATNTALRIASDTRLTAERRRRLQEYMTTRVLGPAGMCCQHLEECKASIRAGDRFDAGQLSHVGHHYDLRIDETDVRIMVVGQEPGLWSLDPAIHHRQGVSLQERYELIHDDSGIHARYYADTGHPARNPHMRGTTSALRLLLGRGLGTDHDDEFLESITGERFHIFDAYALVNVLLCAAGPPNSSRGRSSSTMRRNCLAHFDATMQILEPTIVILQGIGVRKWLRPSIDPASETAITQQVSTAKLSGVPTVLCSLTHPSAYGLQGWGSSLDRPYLLNTVAPALQTALTRLHETVQPGSHNRR